MATFLALFRPAYDAIFSTLPFMFRWRLLCLQPISLLTGSIALLPWLFSNRYRARWIPTRSGSIRTIIFQPPNRIKDARVRPLHLNVHGGGFLGGTAEDNAQWCAVLSDKSGAVVVSTEYRCAPRYPFPGAIDDVDDVVTWLQKHAQEELGANPELLTVSGFSAGGNLALAAALQPQCHYPSRTAFKAALTHYAPVS
jgi:acetyl esterase/lipase